MDALIWALCMRAVPYLTRLFWPVLACIVLAGSGIQVGLGAVNGSFDRIYALVLFAAIIIGIAASITWAVGSIREYRRAESPRPHL